MEAKQTVKERFNVNVRAVFVSASKRRCACFSFVFCCFLLAQTLPAEPWYGPAFAHFRLTLAPGERTEAAGPLYYKQISDTSTLWAIPPAVSYTQDPALDYEELDVLYPFLTYDRFGAEYRFQIFQLLAFSGGQSFSDTNVHRFTLFPIYFQQRSRIPERNYTAVLPIYGHLQGRLFRDEVFFVMMPIYVRTRKRDVITENYVYPFFHLRHGNQLEGWQFWPLYGQEHKGVTYRTNNWNEAELIGGHDRRFILWPLWMTQHAGIGTDNPEKQWASLPLFTITRSPKRDSFTAPWPFGYTKTVDRERKYTEYGAPWPLVVFARGEGKTTTRFFPLFSKAKTATHESDWYLWPVYKYNRINAPPLDRRRMRILLYLYSDILEKNTENGDRYHRVDFWPLFTSRRDFNGNHRLQVLSILDPILPNNKSIERNYSPLYALWRAEHNPKSEIKTQSLLWNLYRREAGPQSKKVSLLFGLFQYQSHAEGKSWRIGYVPIGKGAAPEAKK